MREGLEQPRARLRASTPLSQPRQKRERGERTAHKEEPRIEREKLKTAEKRGKQVSHPHIIIFQKCSKTWQAATDIWHQVVKVWKTIKLKSLRKHLKEDWHLLTPSRKCRMKWRKDATERREDLKQAVHMTQEEFEKTVNSLHQELDELIDKRKPMQSHSSLHDYVLRKQYKQVAGTLVMQDIEPPEDQLQVHLTRRQRGREEHRSTRATREAEAPRFECPILIKQGYAQYIPWAGQDLDTLVSRLPDIHEGAGKWIRTFEEETVGKLLALGDIKALLAKCLGASKMNDILKQSSLLQAVDRPQEDGISFDKHRHNIWMTLRAEYPMQTDPGFLKGEPMEETENPITYIQKQLRRWKEELERDPEKDKLLTALFRTAIVEAMPSTVKVKLEDVVGLNSKSHKEFRDHVVHAVEQYRRQKLKVKDQEKELQRKLTQMQLEELLNKKKKVQAVQKEDQSAVMAPVNTSVPVNPPAPMNVHPPAYQTATAQATPCLGNI